MNLQFPFDALLIKSTIQIIISLKYKFAMQLLQELCLPNIYAYIIN